MQRTCVTEQVMEPREEREVNKVRFGLDLWLDLRNVTHHSHRTMVMVSFAEIQILETFGI
jgi:hypothetical protein